MEPGQFPQGDTFVEYVAVDNAGNKASCNITISVQSKYSFIVSELYGIW